MALIFPNNPALNDTYTEGSTTWKWDGRGWSVLPAEDVEFNTLTATTLTADDISVTTSLGVATLNVVDLNVTGTTTGITTSLALDDLTNVSAPSPTEGQVLKYISGSWIPASDLSGGGPGGGIGLTDLSVTTLSASGGGSLVYSNVTGTFTFRPADLSTYATISYVDTAISEIPTGSPGGSTTHVQYNKDGVFTGDANLTYDDTTQTLSITEIDASTINTTDLIATGEISNTNTTESTSTSTGSLITSGGVGIAGQINVGGTTSSFSSTTASTSINTGAVVIAGGVGVSGAINVGSTVSSSVSPTENEHLTNKEYVDITSIAFSVAFGA